LLIANPAHAKSLALNYRWYVFPPNGNVKFHFESSFEKNSGTFQLLSETQRCQLWTDLIFWPDQNEYDWAHFFIQPIITFDWKPQYAKEKGVKSICEINELLAEDRPDFEFRIKSH
jgi:hypothetical protein